MLGFTAAVALLAFGARLLALRHASEASALLGMFALLWGANVALVRLWGLDPPSGRAYLLAAVAFYVPLSFFLVQFAAVFPTRLRAVKHRWWLPLLALPALAWFAVLPFDATASVRAPDPTGGVVYGWAVFALLTPALLAGLLLALGRFAHGYATATDPALRAPLGLATTGFLAYLSYWLAGLLLHLGPTGGSAAKFYGDAVADVYAVTVVAGVGVTALLGAYLVTRSAGRERIRWLVVVAGSALAAALTSPYDTGGGFLGLFRLLMVGLLGYAVAKHRLFDAELRMTAVARSAGPLALGLAVWGSAATVAATAFDARGPTQPLAFFFAGVLGLAAGLAARPWVARALDAQFPYVRATEEYVLRRKLEVYRAAAEGGAEEAELSDLAKRLKLSNDQRRLASLPAPPEARDRSAPLAKRYRLEGLMTQGVYGPVYLAWDTRVKERVVLKEYQGFGAAAMRSFAREAKALGELEHPSIIAIRDVFRDGDHLYLSLEHAAEGSLEELPRGALPLSGALDLGEQLLSALARAHKAGIVHRDVKPSNILLHKGRVKLADFGIAVDPVLDGAVRASRSTSGTLAWMAPEQALGEGASAASDVYAAGAVLYRLLAGVHYLDLRGLGEQAARRAVAERPAVLPLAGVPAEVNAVLARALAKRPAERFADAGEMLRALRKARREAALALRKAHRSEAAQAYDAAIG